MKIIALSLIMTVLYANDEMLHVLQKIAGVQYAVKSFDTGQYEISKIEPCNGYAVVPSMGPVEADSKVTPWIILTRVSLKEYEKVEDIPKVNKYLTDKLKTLEVNLESIPHQTDSKGGRKYGYVLRNENDLQSLAEYDAIRSAIRPIPTFKFNNSCYDVHCLGYEFKNESDGQLFMGIIGKLNNLEIPTK